jgi:hypothetical protein
MDMSKFTGEPYLKVDDVRNGPLRMTITMVKSGSFNRPELIFSNGNVLSLNVSNTRILTKAFGPDSDRWIGCEIDLQFGSVPFKGELTDSVIAVPVSPPIGEAELKEAQKRIAANHRAAMDDEIPF